MKDFKRSHKLYAAWEYEKEEEDLNEASKAGWQLIKGGCFSSTFRKDDAIRYMYQLDYMPNMKDRSRYIEVFKEQGWEYINSTFNGWHYFRKRYEEGTNVEDYKIYTDKQSLYEMQNRWIRMITVLFFFNLILSIGYGAGSFYSKEPLWIIETVIFILLTLSLGFGLMSIRRSRKGLKNNINLPIQIVLPTTIILLMICFGILFFKIASNAPVVYHTNFTYIRMPEDKLPAVTDKIVIKKKGEHKLDLVISSSAVMVQVNIQDSVGNKVFEISADRCTINNHKVVLDEGTYRVSYNYLFDHYDKDTAQVSVELKLKK